MYVEHNIRPSSNEHLIQFKSDIKRPNYDKLFTVG